MGDRQLHHKLTWHLRCPGVFLDRLLSRKDPAGAFTSNGYSIEYGYDAVGNRLSQKVTQNGAITETTYQYDKNDRLQWEKVNGVTSATYQYDANGNTTQKVDVGKGTTTYTWNQDGRLTDVLTADGKAIGYTYDSEGIRTSSVTNGVTTTYLLDKNRDYAQVLAEYVNGQLQTSYVYGHDLISQERGDRTSFYLVDGLGSINVLTDINGNLTDFYTYQAFGKLETQWGGTENNYLFAGEQFDEEVDGYYLRDRFYDADAGRFTRRDTYEGRKNEPLTLHKYLYTHNNPVNFIDPTGYYTLDELGNFVHHAIGVHFQLQDPENHLNNATIAQILKRTGGYRRGMSGNRKQPDLADLETKEIYEIKSHNSRKLGQRDIFTYLSKLHIVDRDWKAGTTYVPPSYMIVPQDSGSIYFITPSQGGDGVITYKRFNWKTPLEIILAFTMAAIAAELIRQIATAQLTRGFV